MELPEPADEDSYMQNWTDGPHLDSLFFSLLLM